MAWLKLLRKILADFPGSFVLGEVRAKTRHSSYANTLYTSVKRQSDNEKFAVKKQKRKNIKWTVHAQNNTFASSDTQADASVCIRAVFCQCYREI